MTDQPSARVDEILKDARAKVDAADAEWLLAFVLGKSRSWLYARSDDTIPGDAVQRYHALLERRIAGEPLAYLTGRKGFWRFELKVTPDTLVPRPETELLVELLLARLSREAPVRVADLGTGSGAIALAIAYERPRAHVVAIDDSAKALEVAKSNAVALRLPNVEFRMGHWCEPLNDGPFDAIASNPPYIALGDIHLEALRYEPASALASGRDGLDAIRDIVRTAPTHLVPGGALLIEHGRDQGPAVRALFEAAGFLDIDTGLDVEHRERVTHGVMPGGASLG
ncbi:peptide chain release factor N(5)-glutamine methyltransferase [Lysobacter sp. A6]|uniref:Release factor glutamine methyltransferase n=1 Tax=Noviluteimonas lactosilytica TaxID=2888523 RepID=A0ABS8JKE0_9GAMM|nr:peptide chain release factor N(5)-glutamine methyltransferase [Lysobacter lactosilyticus]MCC8364064.1 peptide chain release factor N(5)-glutamine methyltransferase [Lysobacter lactosilyticus]